MSAKYQKQTHAPQQTASLFNQIVGAGVQRGWDIKTERLGGLEIDDQLEPGGLLHRKFGRLLPTRRFFIAPLGSKISKLCFFSAPFIPRHVIRACQICSLGRCAVRRPKIDIRGEARDRHICPAQVDVEIFQLCRPAWREHSFDAAAKHPAVSRRTGKMPR